MKDFSAVVFALNASRSFGECVATHLGTTLGELEERDFEDGEHKSRPLINVRDREVYVIQSLHSDAGQTVNDKLVRLLVFIGALRDAAAGRITVVIPYLAYARKDKKTKSRDPVTTRYVAALIEAVGADGVITLDVHNLAAYQNAFRIRTEHLEAKHLLIEFFATHLRDVESVSVVSPDAGGLKRAEQFRLALEPELGLDIPRGFMEKSRSRGQLTAGNLYGDVNGSVAIIIDDMISTGGTLSYAAQACKERGAKRVYAAASHGVFVSGANAALAAEALDGVVITDSISPTRLDPGLIENKLTILSCAGLFAEAIKRMHTGGSIVELLKIE